MEYTVNSDKSQADFMRDMERLYDEKKYLRITVKTGRQRTNKQNAALHLYLTNLAKALDEKHLDFRQTLRQEVEIPWTMELCKEYLWKPLQEAVINKDSTADAERGEYSKVYDVLNRHLIEKIGIYVPWPEFENIK